MSIPPLPNTVSLALTEPATDAQLEAQEALSMVLFVPMALASKSQF